MIHQEIIKHLIKTSTLVSENSHYSDLPGIYAFSFVGNQFLIDDYEIPEHRVIYIGKTESSQKKRNANTHFKTGKTGSSTVRKTIGSLLSQKTKMTPIIRNQSDVDKNRLSHFKFDPKSEEKITEWMVNNLAVSFYEYPESKGEIKALEESLIKHFKPVLNLTNEFHNPYKTLIQSLRKEMGEKAFASAGKPLPQTKFVRNIIQPKTKNMNLNTTKMQGKYIEIWEQYLPEIKEGIRNGNTQIPLDENLFHQAGDRNKYSFRIEFYNDQVNNNLGGSAVARDLVKVMEAKRVSGGNKVIRMGKDFVLEIK